MEIQVAHPPRDVRSGSEVVQLVLRRNMSSVTLACARSESLSPKHWRGTLGFSEWFTRTKCAECGRKIEGARFDRTVMGTKVWVCFACNEKPKEERRFDTERNLTGAAEGGQESVDTQQKRAAQ